MFFKLILPNLIGISVAATVSSGIYLLVNQSYVVLACVTMGLLVGVLTATILIGFSIVISQLKKLTVEKQKEKICPLGK